jgi:hypothetical protein
MYYWLPKRSRPMILVPECPFRINPDPIRTASGLHMAVQDDQLWLVSDKAARDHGDEIPFLCEGDLYEGMLIDGSTPFLLPVLYPLWNPGEWSESLIRSPCQPASSLPYHPYDPIRSCPPRSLPSDRGVLLVTPLPLFRQRLKQSWR